MASQTTPRRTAPSVSEISAGRVTGRERYRSRGLQLEIVCPSCGAPVWVNANAGRAPEHYAHGTQMRCAMSRHLIYKAELELSAPPLKQLVRRKAPCYHCGRIVSVSRRRGQLYTHNLPESTIVCPASQTLDPSIPATRPPKNPPVQPLPLVKPRQAVQHDLPVDDRWPSSSVRTVSGGLPTMGKRAR